MRTWVRFPSPPPTYAKASVGTPVKVYKNLKSFDRNMISVGCPPKPCAKDGPGAAINKTEYFMYYVYLIKSVHFPNKTYVGLTKSVDDRPYSS